MARVKALIRILDVEKDTIGKILNKQLRIVFGNIYGSCEVFFEGRKDIIFLQYPGGFLFVEIPDPSEDV